MITDTAGNVVWQWDNSDPFGNNVPNQNPSGLGVFEFNKRFSGQYADTETNTYYNYFRDCYDPVTGRYCQSDPIGLRGVINTFTYALGNPLGYIDPTGLDVWIEGPSGNEPSLHQSVNVGNPNGTYYSYSFGMNGNGLEGEVYRGTSLGGPIEEYKKTTLWEDMQFRKLLESQVGDKGTYGNDDICRSWSQRQFKRVHGFKSEPPARVISPHLNISPSSSQTLTGASSTTGTGTSQ